MRSFAVYLGCEAIVTLALSKPDWFEFEDLQALLLAHESRNATQQEVHDPVPSLNLTHAVANRSPALQVPANANPQVQYTNSASQNQNQNLASSDDKASDYRGAVAVASTE